MLLRGGKVVMTSQLIMMSQLLMTSQLDMMQQPSLFFVSKLFNKSRLIEVAAYILYSTRMLLLLIRNGILIHKMNLVLV